MIRSRTVFLGWAAGVAASVFLIVVLVRHGLEQASLWAALVAAIAAVLALIPRRPVAPEVLMSPELRKPDWVVDRPAEVTEASAALLDRHAELVGITTTLYGAGGFGKTTLARMVCADRRIREHFRGQVYMVTMGRDVRSAAAIAGKVNDVIKLIGGEDATFTDPELAGQRLALLLETGPRRLLVLDDVWEDEQLAPFTGASWHCARLVTTRNPQLLGGQAVAVRVDQMSQDQAHQLLTHDLPPLDPTVERALLTVTGLWPLLLRLVNKILADAVRAGQDVSAAGAALLGRLRAGGPGAVDDLLGESGLLDVGQPEKRNRAVRATIEASTRLLGPQDAQRFAELAVFAADETIPFHLIARLWRITADLDPLQTTRICARLADLALLSLSTSTNDSGGIILHDVVRDFIRGELGPQRLAALHETVIEGVTAYLPMASPLAAGIPTPARVAWWEMEATEQYPWNHLIEHLINAGRLEDAAAVATDLRWVGARLQLFGPTAPAADLALIRTSQAARLQALVERAAHLLAPTKPAEAVVDILHSRVASDPYWGPQVDALRNSFDRPRLTNRLPPPDLPDAALQRVLRGHVGRAVAAVAVAPDGSWVAAGEAYSEAVRIWDTATWKSRATLAGHVGGVNAVAVAPDGSWLAAACGRKVRVWDTSKWKARATRYGHVGKVQALAVAPDGAWLDAGGRTMRAWDTDTWKPRARRTGYGMMEAMAATRGVTRVQALAVAPDGSWIAAADGYRAMQIWDTTTWRTWTPLAELTDVGTVEALAVAPDGSWLAAACGYHQQVQIWDTTTWQVRTTLTGHAGSVKAIAVAPDGTWLAAGDHVGVRIWDATGQAHATITDQARAVQELAVAPDGSWLASGGGFNGMMQIWDTTTWQVRTTMADGVEAVVATPDGSWLAACGWQTVQIRDTATWQVQETLTGRFASGSNAALAVAPNRSWLAVGEIFGGKVRIFDTVTWKSRATLTVSLLRALAAAPDSTWLATGSRTGKVQIWDSATWEAKITLARQAGRVTEMAVAPDGSWLAVGGPTVQIWDTADWTIRTTLDGGAGVTAMAAASNNKHLATGYYDGRVQIWDVISGQPLAVMRIDNSIRACAWPDVSGLAVGGPAGLYLFDFIIANARP